MFRSTVSHLQFAFSALLGLTCLALPAVSNGDVSVFVAPGGNDGWSGMLADANAAKSDGPLATPGHARDVARQMKAQHPNEAIAIQLRGGTYFLAEPLTLTPEDSGSEKAPVVWSAYKNERPILSGGRRITEWKPTQINGHEGWVAKLPENGQPPFTFRELWINGQPAPLARLPRKGTFAVPRELKEKNADWRTQSPDFAFAPGDLKAWPGSTAGEAVIMSRWVESRLPIASIDETTHILHSTKLAGFAAETGDRYYIENVKELVSEPGEWYYDAKENAVYLIAPANAPSPDAAEIIAPSLTEVLRLNGDVASKHWIEHVTFSGLTFSHNEWYYDHVAKGQTPDLKSSCCPQAAVSVPAAIVGDSVRSCTFSACTIQHAGSYGIALGRACQNNKITHCTITDLGAGGIKIGETSIRDNAEAQAFGNEISNCIITDGGKIFPSAVGVWIGQSHDNTLSHNEIGRFWYTGISVGWTWGYAKALTQNNKIENNIIHHIGIKEDGDGPLLSDMGGIYTLGNEKGTVIRNNIFHDIGALHYGGWGIYFDEGTTDILAESNLVYRTTHGGFHQHYGKDNVVRNNIFAFGRDMQIQRTRLENHTSFTFENNIVYWDTGALLTGDWSKFNVVFDNNTYWQVGGKPFTFAKLNWQQWRDARMDVHSAIADPGFQDPAKGDFQFRDKPPAGFTAFDPQDAGPQPWH